VLLEPYRLSIYDKLMAIQSFKCGATKRLFERERVKQCIIFCSVAEI